MPWRQLVWGLVGVVLALPLASLSAMDGSALVRAWPWAWLVLAAALPVAAFGLLALTGSFVVPLTIWLGPVPFGGNEMLELQVLAVLSGVCLHWAWRGPPAPGRLGQPALLLGAVVAASGVVVLAAEPELIVIGNEWLTGLWQYATRHYFSDSRAFPAWHAAAIWVEALLLAVVLERQIRLQPRTGPWLAGLAAAGLATAASWSLIRLAQVAARSPEFAPTFWHHLVSTRISPHFPDLNAMGSLFALGTVACLVWLIGPGVQWTRRVAAACGTGLMAGGLWLTQSRAALVSAAVVAGIAWLVLQRPRRNVILAVGAAVVVLVGAAAALGIVRVSRAPASTALDIRIELTKVGGRMAKDHPWFGVGLGRFREESPPYIPPALVAVFPVVAAGENAHNQLIQVLGELGVVGLIAFLLFWGSLLGPAALRVARERRTSWLAAWTCGLLAFMISALLGHPFLTPFVTLTTFLIVGLVAALLPARSPVTVRRWTWAVLAACVVLAVSVPMRVVQARRAVDLDNVFVGASRFAGELDGVRYRIAESRSTWFVRTTARSVEIPLRSQSDAGCEVAVTVDGLPADVVQVTPERWRSVRFTFREPETRWNSRRIELATSVAGCELLVGRIQVVD
jgi:O-antigen ligase